MKTLLAITLIINIILLIISYVAIHIYYKYYHKFWDKQPISKYNTIFKSDGIITLSSPPSPIMSEQFKINSFNTNDDLLLYKICTFLTNNYIDVQGWTYKYDINYLKWSLNSNLSTDRINLYLTDKDKKDESIVGCITSRPHKIYIRNKESYVLYVDNLCVAKEYRKKNIASILISHMAHNGYIKNFKSYIFRKDSLPLPFRFITRFKNTIYYLPQTTETLSNNNIVKNNILKVNKQDIKIIYPIYIEYIKTFKNYLYYSIEEFEYYFINEHVNVYYDLSKDNEIQNIIFTYDNKLQLDGKKVIDIPHIITRYNGQYVYNIFTLNFSMRVLSLLKMKGYYFCNINNIDYLNILTNKLQTYRYYYTYTHMYNYHLSVPLLNSNYYFM